MSLNLLKYRSDKVEHSEVSFRQLFMDYYPSLLSYALKYVEEGTAAEDLVQDVFVKLWENWERISQMEDLSAYIYQMVRFKCFNHLRNEKVRGNATQLFTEELDITEMNNYIREETFRMVSKAMENLPPSCHQIFSMTLEGYSAKDIAEQLQIAVETVKKQKQIARRILKDKLGHCFVYLFVICPQLYS